MRAEIIIAGFGGQGVLFAGQLLAYAALAEGRHVTWIPSYGPEMRGGTANCAVVVSDEEIGSPFVPRPTGAIVMNPPSLQRYAPLVQPGGALVTDSAMAPGSISRHDICSVDVPAQQIAADLGFPQIANMVLLGALVAATGVVALESVEGALVEHTSARRREALPANIQALRRGAALAREPALV